MKIVLLGSSCWDRFSARMLFFTMDSLILLYLIRDKESHSNEDWKDSLRLPTPTFYRSSTGAA